MLEIRLLGQFDIRRDGQPVEIPTRPAKLLLAYLVLTAGTRHPRERLAGLLWPDSTEADARNNLRQALWRLRKAIGDSYVLTDNASLAFDATSDFWLDTAMLEDTAEPDLSAIASVSTGELLPGFYEDWVLLERERLNAAFERKLQRLMQRLVQERRWAEALEWGERWIARGQVPEAAYRALMVAHAAKGELSKVDEVYHRCVEALQREVGVSPSKETQTLYERLIAGEAAPPYPYQQEPGEAMSLVTRRQKLPTQPTPFIGRKKERAEIKRLVANTRLLTLTGPGGTGKTRLALQVAADLFNDFSHGACFVSLAPIRSPDHIPQTIAEALDLPLSTQEDPVAQLVSHLRKRRLLMVLDNFEHLLDGAGMVSEILQAAPGVKVLATARERLNLLGETVLSVASMSLPEAGTHDDLLTYDAVNLFVQSARRVRPAFEPVADNLRQVAHICQIVEGMPLAIELAAAWLAMMSLGEIADELQEGLDILATEMRDLPERHRSIRAAFDHSWSLMDRVEQEVFMRFSVFRGGFTRAAAQQVAGATLQTLAGLVNKSLLRHDPDAARFEIHELLRRYAEERLEATPGAGNSAHDAHAAYYAEFMQQRWEHLKDGRQTLALAEIEADIENVRKAWRHRCEQKNVAQMRMFVDSFWLVHLVRGWNHAAVALFGEAVEALRDLPGNVEAEALGAMALAYQSFFMAWLGLSEQAYGLAKESVEVLERLDRPRELVAAYDGLNLNAYCLNRTVEQMWTARKLVEVATELDDRWLLAYAIFLMSVGAYEQQRYAEARRHAENGLRLTEEIGDLIGSTYALSTLSHVALAVGEYEKARDYHLRRLEASEKLGYRWSIQNSLKYLGQVALAMGDIPEAEAYFRRSLQIAEEIGLGRDIANLLFEFARVRVAQNALEQAVELLALALEHPAGRQNRFGEGPIHDSAQSLLDDLKAQLSSETYAAALVRGRALDLDAIVTALIDGT